MIELFLSVLTQAAPFIPLAFGIAISYNILRATDMTIDGSFVLGAALFAKLVTLGVSPVLAAICALGGGAFAGVMTAFIQRGGKVDALLAGILSTFILSSFNLVLMGRPNINLLTVDTMISPFQLISDIAGLAAALLIALIITLSVLLILRGNYGLKLRAFGDNPQLFQRLGNAVEMYRMSGFALTNALAAGSGMLTAQMSGFADISMGFGMTLTGIGAIILGYYVMKKISKRHYFRTGLEFGACLIGVVIYYASLNVLLRIHVDPIYLKMILGILLAIFLRAAVKRQGVAA